MSASSTNTSRQSANRFPANSLPESKGHAVSERVYRLLLLAYPLEFRREYGPHMAQLFRDCCRATDTRYGRMWLWRLWQRTLLDLAQTAPKEHLENLRKENSVMKNLRNDALALCCCIGIIVIAVVLLSYGKKHDVSSILVFGNALDALVTAGVIGNLIVFLLVKTTRLNSLRSALWTFLAVNATLLFVTVLIGNRVDPQFSLGSVLIGYIVSFLFWFGLHWMWARSSGQLAVSGGDNP